MRLGQLTAFEVRGLPEHLTRLLVYCDAKESPVFACEAQIPQNGVAQWPVPPIENINVRRAYRIALRAWQYINGEWILIKSVSLDLRYLIAVTASDMDREWFFLRDQQTWGIVPPRETQSQQEDAGLTTSLSYDAMNEIWTLQQCVDDARAASVDLQAEINSMVMRSYTKKKCRQKELERYIGRILGSIKMTKAAAAQSRAASSAIRAKAGATSRNLRKSSSETHRIVSTFKALKFENLDCQIRAEQGRLARQLLEVFPLEPVGQSFHFSICGLVLPSVFTINHYDPIQVGAALGFVAQVVVALGVYLDVPLPYTVQPWGSQSWIRDEISQIQGSRVFPLWTKATLLYRVEYGLYLLHKDIEQLMMARELAVVDLKQTLANIKNLLLVLSAD